jgi:hypothetical protein
VSSQAFDVAEPLDQGRGLFQCGAIQFHDAGAALELIDGESGERFAGSSGG